MSKAKKEVSGYEPDDSQDNAEKAYVRSDKHVFNAQRLQPWTPSRVIAAQNIGIKFPHLSEADWAQLKATKSYPSMLKDIVLVLWLCHLSDSKVDDADCMVPGDAYKAAKKWAGDLKITVLDSDEYWQAYNLFWEIMMEVRNSKSQPKGKAESAASGKA